MSPPLYNRRKDDYDPVTNADLFEAIQGLQERVAKLEARISYIFGGFAVATIAVTIFEAISRTAH